MVQTKAETQVILFDLGGVLITDGREVTENILGGLGLDRRMAKSLWNQFWPPAAIGREKEDYIWRNIIQAAKLNVSVGYLADKYDAGFEAFPNNFEIVERVRHNGYKTGLLTNNIEEWFDYQKKKFNLEKYFDGFIISDRVKAMKPDRIIFEYALNLFKIQPQEAIFIDDYKEYTEAATSFGIYGITLERPELLRQKLIEVGVKL